MLMCIGVSLWFKIGIIKKRGLEKVVYAYTKSLTHFMNDSQFHRIVSAIDDIANRGLGYAAFHE